MVYFYIIKKTLLIILPFRRNQYVSILVFILSISFLFFSFPCKHRSALFFLNSYMAFYCMNVHLKNLIRVLFTGIWVFPQFIFFLCAFSFVPLSMMLTMGLSYMAFVMLRYITLIPSFLGIFYHKRMLNFVKCLFSIY